MQVPDKRLADLPGARRRAFCESINDRSGDVVFIEVAHSLAPFWFTPASQPGTPVWLPRQPERCAVKP
jgi:hypothetical protein